MIDTLIAAWLLLFLCSPLWIMFLVPFFARNPLRPILLMPFFGVGVGFLLGIFGAILASKSERCASSVDCLSAAASS